MTTTQKVMQWEARYCRFFETDTLWQEKMEKDIKSQSDGKIRAFQIFFKSPEDCFSGQFRAQALSKQDVINMYPSLYEAITKVPQAKFMYIFNCNDGSGPGKALSVNTII